MNLIILGPPGAGKGTQSTFLVEQYKFAHLSTGDLLRDEITGKTEVGLLAKSYMDQGKYVPDDVMNQIIKNKITQLKDNFILDGYPRTMNQVKFLQATLAQINKKIDLVIYLDIKEPTVIKRLGARLICPTCKRTYNKVFLPPKVDTLCDFDGTHLIQRTDDSNNEKIVTRIREYTTMTQPLVDYFQKTKILKVVDANQDTKNIHQQLVKIIEAENGHN